jgi:DNA-binding PadR family transcriptional regulator
MRQDELYVQFDNTFFEKTRLSMITLLYREKSVSFNRFKKVIRGTDGAIYAHLRKLSDAGYVNAKKEIVGENVQTTYTLTTFGKTAFRKYLDFLERTFITHRKEN